MSEYIYLFITDDENDKEDDLMILIRSISQA